MGENPRDLLIDVQKSRGGFDHLWERGVFCPDRVKTFDKSQLVELLQGCLRYDGKSPLQKNRPGHCGPILLHFASRPSVKQKELNMKIYGCLIFVALLVAIPGCGETPNANQADGIKDAFDARSHEGIRDAGEDLDDAVKDAGKGIKNVGENLKDAVVDE